MTLSEHVTNFLVSCYKNINRTNLLNSNWARSVFISGYFNYKKYLEDSTAKLIKNYPELFQNGHILDIGANIGYTSYIFSKVLTPPYTIYAFEPENNNLNLLKRAARRYSFSNKIKVAAVAVGDRESEIEIWKNEGHHADHRVLTDEFRKKLKDDIIVQKTPLVTIDNFLKLQHSTQPISFIKIDVQGYELAVCEGMKETLLRNPNCTVLFEYCPAIMEALGFSARELIQFFKDRNYSFYMLEKDGSLRNFNPDSDESIKICEDSSKYFDIICSRNIY